MEVRILDKYNEFITSIARSEPTVRRNPHIQHSISLVTHPRKVNYIKSILLFKDSFKFYFCNMDSKMNYPHVPKEVKFDRKKNILYFSKKITRICMV